MTASGTCAVVYLSLVAYMAAPTSVGEIRLIQGSGGRMAWSMDDRMIFCSGPSTGGDVISVNRANVEGHFDLKVVQEVDFDETQPSSDGSALVVASGTFVQRLSFPKLESSGKVDVLGAIVAVSTNGQFCALADGKKCTVVDLAGRRIVASIDLPEVAGGISQRGGFIRDQRALAMIVGANHSIPELATASLFLTGVGSAPAPVLKVPELPARPTAVTASPDGRLLAIGLFPNGSELTAKLAVLSADDTTKVKIIDLPNGFFARSVAISTDMMWLGVCGESRLRNNPTADPRRLIVYRLATQTVACEIAEEGAGYKGLCFAHRGTQCAVADDEGVIRVYSWR